MRHDRLHQARFLRVKKANGWNLVDPVEEFSARGLIPEFLLTESAKTGVVTRMFGLKKGFTRLWIEGSVVPRIAAER
jgi:hypothetical protein